MLIALMLAGAALQTQADLNRSTGVSFQAADAAMNRQWKVTLAYMKDRDAQDISRGGGFDYAAALLASQRAWLTFRDAQCAIESAQMAGGSAQGMVRTQCRTRLTGDRTQQLKALMWR